MVRESSRKAMCQRVGHFVCLVAVALWTHGVLGQPRPSEYVPKLSGDWASVREAAVWNEIGVNPDDFIWSTTARSKAQPIGATLRYRDVDEDGLPDVFWSIYDGRVSYSFFAHASSLDTWKTPHPLGRCRYEPREIRRDPSLLEPPMPSSRIAAGRVFLGAPRNSGTPHITDQADTIYELTGDQVIEVIHDVGRASGHSLMRWNILQTSDAGDLLFYTYRSGPHGASLGSDARLLRAGEARVEVVETPSESERIKMSRAGRPRSPIPAGLAELHPLRVSRELSGFPADVVKKEIWKQLGIDPDQYDLQQDEIVAEADRAAGSSYVWYISTAVVYEDFDRDGLPDAFVVLEQGFACRWLVLRQSAPNEWSCAGIVGGIWYEHGFNLSQSPPLPTVKHCGGRVFVLAAGGSTHDLNSQITQTLYVVHEGRLHQLWSEVVHGHHHATQRVSVEQTEAGVRIEVKTWRERLGVSDDAAPSKVRRWLLTPGSVQLTPVNR